jgi:GrpB-like predicted nucleotidyltransferase (UPF0157 family)
MNAAISIVDYDPQWPREYEAEKARLAAALAERIIHIEHIGSTSIPGLAAKPIIDVLLAVPDFSNSEWYASSLRSLGYEFVPEASSTRHFFRKVKDGVRTHHVHIVPAATFWQRHELLFRDHLRAFPVLAAKYAAIKRNLADRLGHDREAYTEAKTPFIQRVVDEACALRGLPYQDVRDDL